MYLAYRCQALYCSLPDTFLDYVWEQKSGSGVAERVLGGDKRREQIRTRGTASQEFTGDPGFARPWAGVGWPLRPRSSVEALVPVSVPPGNRWRFQLGGFGEGE